MLNATLFTKNTLTFLIFVGISTLFWVMNMTGKQREVYIDIPLQYTNMPEDYRFITPLPDEIRVKVRDEGRNVIRYSISEPDAIVINFSAFNVMDTIIQVPYERLEPMIKSSLSPSITLVTTPPLITAVYQKITTKRIPVRLSGEVPLNAQYTLLDSTKLTPETVKASGPPEILDTLQCAYVMPIEGRKVEKSTVLEQSLVAVPEIEFLPNKVQVHVTTEMLAERKMHVPIQCINVPEGVYLHLFPSEVDVVFTIGVSKYQRVDESELSVMLDYKHLSSTGKQHLVPTTTNPFIKSIHTSPAEVEFLIEQNEAR